MLISIVILNVYSLQRYFIEVYIPSHQVFDYRPDRGGCLRFIPSGAASSTALTDEVWPDGVSFDVPVVNPHQPVIISRDAQLIPEGLRKARSSNWMLIVQIGDMNMWAICNTRI
ncbi:uncharacterized protein [Miscanthus floridulus]|uniref:uncharacterized protein isoform X1 n=1 Tax=Miscanthus floridulus TaxID=154761 RepID=UPI003458A6CC